MSSTKELCPCLNWASKFDATRGVFDHHPKCDGTGKRHANTPPAEASVNENEIAFEKVFQGWVNGENKDATLKGECRFIWDACLEHAMKAVNATVEQATYQHNLIAVTDFKARLIERLDELNNGEAYTSESYNYASGRTIAFAEVKKIVEEL